MVSRFSSSRTDGSAGLRACDLLPAEAGAPEDCRVQLDAPEYAEYNSALRKMADFKPELLNPSWIFSA